MPRAVTDTGIGIREDDLDKLFLKFHRFEDENVNRNIEGSGLGLAISREIAERHAIAVSMKSEYGKGATAIMELPKPEEFSEAEMEGSV